MNLNQEILKILMTFYNNHKEDIVAIYIGGSNVSPYISNPHDVDYITVGKNSTSRKTFIKDLITLQQQVKSIDSNYNGLNRTLDFYNDCFLDGKFPTYSYLLPFAQKIVGDIDFLKPFNILSLQKDIIKALEDIINRSHNKKWFYHILINLYIIQNQSYELSSEQQDNVQGVHDNPNSERTEVLYNGALEELNKYKKDSE